MSKDLEEKKPIVVHSKTAKVTPKVSGKRFVAGVWYEFKADKEIEVTTEAKRILKEAGAIYL